MNIRHHLRLINQYDTALSLLKNSHAGSEVRDIPAEGRYLKLILNNEINLKGEAFLDVDIWLQVLGDRLPGIPWQQVPLGYLIPWLSVIELSFILISDIWYVTGISSPTEPLPKKMLSLPAQPCHLYCLKWPESKKVTYYNWHFKQYNIPFLLRFFLGCSELPLSAINDISLGDLLLIQRSCACLKVGEFKLFRLGINNNQEVVVQERFIDNEENDRDDEESLLKWSDLPVEVEFVLDSKTVTLAELDTIQPGTVFSLNDDAEQRVKIFLNRKYFARGELVALETGRLAVEINQINTVSVGELEISDA